MGSRQIAGTLAWSALFLILGNGICRSGLFAQTPVTAGDSIVGRWSGNVGFPEDRNPIAFEIKPDSTGQLRVYLYHPVINYYGLELPGRLTRTPEGYALADAGLLVDFRNGGLEGTYLGLKVPVSLRRTRSLPRDVTLPSLPTRKPAWRTALGAPIYAPVSVDGGDVFVGTTGGAFFSLSVITGKVNWVFTAGRPIHGQATVNGDAVFFAADNGYLFKVSRKSGKELWRYDLGDARTDRILGHPESPDFDWDVEAPRPLLRDGRLYIGSSDGSFHSIDAETGARHWRFESRSKVRTTALITDTLVIFGNWDGSLFALDYRSGTQVWTKAMRAPVTSAAVMVDGVMVLGTRGGVLYGIEPATAKILWRSVFWGSSIESDATAVGADFVIGSSDLRRITRMTAASGKLIWRTDVFGTPWAQPLVVGNDVFVSVLGSTYGPIRHVGSLTAIDLATGKIRWAWRSDPAPGSMFTGFVGAPARAHTGIVVGGLDGSVYAFPLSR